MAQCHKQGCEHYDQRMTDNCSKGEPPNVEECAVRLSSRRSLKEQLDALQAQLQRSEDERAKLATQLDAAIEQAETIRKQRDQSYRMQEELLTTQARLVSQRDEARQEIRQAKELMKGCTSKWSAKKARETAEKYIAGLQEEIHRLRIDLNEADRQVGATLRDNLTLQSSVSARKDWLRKAKAQAGYADSVSFDVVWKETLSRAKLWGGFAGGLLKAAEMIESRLERVKASLSGRDDDFSVGVDNRIKLHIVEFEDLITDIREAASAATQPNLR